MKKKIPLFITIRQLMQLHRLGYLSDEGKDFFIERLMEIKKTEEKKACGWGRSYGYRELVLKNFPNRIKFKLTKKKEKK